jgi:hypothetical protein
LWVGGAGVPLNVAVFLAVFTVPYQKTAKAHLPMKVAVTIFHVGIQLAHNNKPFPAVIRIRYPGASKFPGSDLMISWEI